MLKLYKKYILILVLFILIIIIRTFFITTYNIQGTSMNPTLNNGDKVLITKNYNTLEIGDIIVFKKDKKTYIKRIKGVSNQEIDFNKENKSFTVDGKKIINCCEKYMYKINDIYYESETIVVPPKNFFVMGDNSIDSIDSREFGLINENQIVGKVVYRYWPIFNEDN